jgi:hypothetical protein
MSRKSKRIKDKKSRRRVRFSNVSNFGTPIKDIEKKIKKLLDKHGFDISKVERTKENHAWIYSKLKLITVLAQKGNWRVAESVAIVLGKFCSGEFDPKLEQDLSWIQEFLPVVLPSSWKLLKIVDDGAKYQSVTNQTVIISGNRELDGNRWIHISTAFEDRLPSWEDLKKIKNIFLGKNRWAIQVFPTEDKYVNINPYVLHLWYCVDGEVLPDFTGGSNSI